MSFQLSLSCESQEDEKTEMEYLEEMNIIKNKTNFSGTEEFLI